jgi:hypothetical protein
MASRAAGAGVEAGAAAGTSEADSKSARAGASAPERAAAAATSGSAAPGSAAPKTSVAWAVEESPSSRASCQYCHERIASGEVRWVKKHVSPPPLGELREYLHLRCLKYSHQPHLRFELSDVQGLERLSAPQQKEVRAVFTEKKRASKVGEDAAAPRFATFHGQAATRQRARLAGAPDAGAYADMQCAELRDFLRLNLQLVSGRKEELVARCEDGARRGRLLPCPACGQGTLALDAGAGAGAGAGGPEVRCHGYWDPAIGMREQCAFAVPLAQAAARGVRRGRWLVPGLDDPAAPGQEPQDHAAVEAALAQLAHDAVAALLHAAAARNVNLPAEPAAQRAAAEAALAAVKDDEGHAGLHVWVDRALVELRTRLGLISKVASAAQAPRAHPSALVPANAVLADAIDELAVLEADAHESANYRFKVRADHKAAASIRAAPFRITSGAQIAKGPLKLPGVGSGTAAHVDELLERGFIERARDLKAKRGAASA